MIYKDYISRSEAIDAICDIRCGEKKHTCDGFSCTENKALMDLSSKIILCKDCKYYNHIDWDGTEERFFEDYWCEWAETKEDDFCSLGVRKETDK